MSYEQFMDKLRKDWRPSMDQVVVQQIQKNARKKLKKTEVKGYN